MRLALPDKYGETPDGFESDPAPARKVGAPPVDYRRAALLTGFFFLETSMPFSIL